MADKTQINLERIRACDAEWDESKHKRANNGQFTSGGGATVSKAQSGGKAKVNSVKAGDIPKNQERYDNAHKSMAANYLSDLTNALKEGDYETAREKLDRHEKDKNRYDKLTKQNKKMAAAKATLEKARPGIRQMRADKLGYKKLTGEKASNHPEGEAHNMMVGAMESAGGDFYTAKNKLLNNPRISQEVKNAVKKMKAPAGAKPQSMDGLVQHYIDKGDNERASIAIQLRMEMMDGHDLRGAVHNLLSKYDEAEDKGWMDRESYDKNVDMLLNEVSGDAYSALNPAKPANTSKKNEMVSKINSDPKLKAEVMSLKGKPKAAPAKTAQVAKPAAKTTTRFDKDKELAAKSTEDFRKVMQRRLNEIEDLKERLRTTKNSFVAKATRQDLDKRLREVQELEDLY